MNDYSPTISAQSNCKSTLVGVTVNEHFALKCYSLALAREKMLQVISTPLTPRSFQVSPSSSSSCVISSISDFSLSLSFHLFYSLTVFFYISCVRGRKKAHTPLSSYYLWRVMLVINISMTKMLSMFQYSSHCSNISFLSFFIFLLWRNLTVRTMPLSFFEMLRYII